MEIADILAAIAATSAQGNRKVIAIVGPPASGKSTFAESLANQIPQARVVPMDGFHRSNDDLRRHGLLDRKGAPETFEAAAFVKLIKAIRDTGQVSFPTFDRGRDCVVPAGGRIEAQDQTILVEGNYLLLNSEPWSELSKLWDFSVMLDVPLEVLQGRLVERWLENGYDAKNSLSRAEHNDLPNAKLVLTSSLPATMTIQNT